MNNFAHALLLAGYIQIYGSKNGANSTLLQLINKHQFFFISLGPFCLIQYCSDSEIDQLTYSLSHISWDGSRHPALSMLVYKIGQKNSVKKETVSRGPGEGTYTKHGLPVHGPPLWTRSMDHLCGPGPWTTPVDHPLFYKSNKKNYNKATKRN